jgi:RNAse (barnase) inhibitor barstar
VTALRALAADGLPPGVYRWRTADPAADVRADADAAGWSFVLLDTTDVGDKAGFLDVCATAFDLPRWFGRNWDALADSLGDRSTGRPEVVLWEGWQQLAAGDLDAFDVALQIFAEDALSSGQLRVLLRESSADADLLGPALADVRVLQTGL